MKHSSSSNAPAKRQSVPRVWPCSFGKFSLGKPLLGGFELSGMGRKPLPFLQAWQSDSDPAFQSACVWLGWDEALLYVLAELEGRAPSNPIKAFNVPSFDSGDVFEIFLKPRGQESYFEIHVNPNNQQVQLRIPSVEEFKQVREVGLPKTWYVNLPDLTSNVTVDPARGKWFVYVEIPHAQLTEAKKLVVGDQWEVNFARYDYSANGEIPVLSATALLQQPDFHRIQEWDVLEFKSFSE